MYTLAQMIGQGYRYGAPTQEAEDIDVQVTKSMKCRKCGGSMHYEGYHRPGEYVAVAVCNECGREVAF
jgi:hypothetical protein